MLSVIVDTPVRYDLHSIPMASTLPSRLRRISRAMGWSRDEEAARIAQASGATRKTVTRWLRDGEILMDAHYGFRLADSVGFSARWIILGEGEPRPTTVDITALPEPLRGEVVRHLHVLAVSITALTKGKTR